MKNLAGVADGPHEVVLRSGPGITHSFHGQEIRFGWMLHLVGGIQKDLFTLDQGAKVWAKSPRITICVDGELDLQRLQVPKGVTLASLDELSRRGRGALDSSDKTVRGSVRRACALDPFNAENLSAVAKLLDDKDDGVRLSAAGALALFGKKAEPLLPTLREHLKTDNKQLQSQLEETIRKIEQAEDTAAAEREHRFAIQDRIHKYLDRTRWQEVTRVVQGPAVRFWLGPSLGLSSRWFCLPSVSGLTCIHSTFSEQFSWSLRF